MAWPTSHLVRFVADVICPERCAACETIVRADVLFCRACAEHVQRFRGSECGRCGQPAGSGAAGGECAAPVSGGCAAHPLVDGCAAHSSVVRSTRAWAAYRDGEGLSPVARAIAAFKYGRAQRLGPRLAAALRTRIPDPAVGLVVPVPLHPRRLRQRGFNQSAVLARHLGRLIQRPTALTLVVRTRDTPSQTALDVEARTRNLADAFAVRDPRRVAGRTLLVVDDVWTTGATARAVATTLRDAGAAAVDVVTIARVL